MAEEWGLAPENEHVIDYIVVDEEDTYGRVLYRVPWYFLRL